MNKKKKTEKLKADSFRPEAPKQTVAEQPLASNKAVVSGDFASSDGGQKRLILILACVAALLIVLTGAGLLVKNSLDNGTAQDPLSSDVVATEYSDDLPDDQKAVLEFNVGSTYEAKNNKPKAYQQYALASDLNPLEMTYAREAAVLAKELKKPAEADKYAKRAVNAAMAANKKNPKDYPVGAFNTIAVLAEEAGDVKTAIVYYERIVQLPEAPEDEEAVAFRAAAQQKLAELK